MTYIPNKSSCLKLKKLASKSKTRHNNPSKLMRMQDILKIQGYKTRWHKTF